MHTVDTSPTLSRAQDKAPSPETSDEALIASIAAGDRRAMELLFGRHNVRIYRFILHIIGDALLAEDIVSEVFLDVWRGAGRFKERSQVSTWLLAIARYKALTAGRRRTEAQLNDDAGAATVDDAANPKAGAHEAMRLPPSQREIVDLVYYHEKTVAEVAQIIGIPPGTVKTRMFGARTRMAELAAADADAFMILRPATPTLIRRPR
jgi:RNA polymerase sigma-70 factor (ECF subfamily)